MKIVVVIMALALTLSGQRAANSLIFDAPGALHDLEFLSADDMEGRAFGTNGNLKARNYIVRRFSDAGLKPFYQTHLQAFRGGANILGVIEGTGGTGRYMVVTAHYDHLGIREGKLYNGANDNASGVAGMIAVADYFRKNPPRNGIIFAALDAEETSGAGARSFLENPPVARAAIAMNINLDMIARAPDNKLFAVGVYHYPHLQPYIDAVAARSALTLLRGHDRPDQPGIEDWTQDSDHVWFHRAKIPFIYFGVEDFEQHHEPTDDFDTITAGFFINAIETVVDALKVFDVNLETIQSGSE